MSDRPEEDSLQARLKRALEVLHLTSLAEALADLLAWARKERPSALALLDRALAADVERTVTRAIDRRLQASGLPDRPTLEAFDWNFQPGLDKALILQLAELDFIRAHEDIIFTGTSGTGKSHLLKAIAVRACSQGVRVLYRQFHVLLDDLYAGLADGTYEHKLARYARADFLLIDDVGLGRVRRSADEPTAAHMLFALIGQRVGKRSTAVSSNIKLSAWGPYLGDASLSMAILDRIVEHATRIEIEGPSYRDKQSQALNQQRRASARKREPAREREAHLDK